MIFYQTVKLYRISTNTISGYTLPTPINLDSGIGGRGFYELSLMEREKTKIICTPDDKLLSEILDNKNKNTITITIDMSKHFDVLEYKECHEQIKYDNGEYSRDIKVSFKARLSSDFKNTPTNEIENKDIHRRSLNDLIIEYNLSKDEIITISNYLVAIRMTQKGIPPEKLMKVVDNWDRINKAIDILKFDFN